MDEIVQVADEISFAVFKETSIEGPCFGLEFREVAQIFESIIFAQKRLLLVVVGHESL